MLTALFN